MQVLLSSLVEEASRYLGSARIADYCPNGLQVQGRPVVQRIISGVTASQALLDAAVEAGADLLLVHHGYFWKGEDPCVTGIRQHRLKTLLGHDISLLAYHLPLDMHPEVGNNVQLARLLGFGIDGPLEPGNPKSVGLVGHLEQPLSPVALQQHVSQMLDHEALLVAGSRPVQRIAWCTGAAQGQISQALAMGVDAYLTGEVSEQTVHIARETGLTFLAAGHHATERYGVQALGRYLAEHFGVEHHFIDCPVPV